VIDPAARPTSVPDLFPKGRLVKDLPSIEQLQELVSLLAPGFITLSLRSAVQGGARPELKDRLVHYAAISAAYYAVAFPLFNWTNGLVLNESLWYLLQYFAVPLILGALAAYEAQEYWLLRLAARIRLHLAHPIPAAWDYAFSRMRSGSFVLVTLAEGDRIAGLVGRHSFASSSREERDLLIERVWIPNDSGAWVESQPPRSILLCGGDIRHVEIF
jgi:hypothetical protein